MNNISESLVKSLKDHFDEMCMSIICLIQCDSHIISSYIREGRDDKGREG